MQRHVFVHDDPDRLAVPDAPGVGASSPAFADVDGDGRAELVVATDEGIVHAFGRRRHRACRASRPHTGPAP